MMSDSKKIIEKIGFEKFAEEVEKVRKDRDADNIIVCFNHYENGKQTRQVYFSDNEDNKKMIEKLIEKDIMEEINKDQRLYKLTDDEMSRKKFQPKIHEILKNMKN